MLKFSTHAPKIHIILLRKHIIQSSTHGQHTNPIQCNTRKRSYKTLISVLGATVLAGSAIAYAKHSPEVRNTIQTNVPALDRLIAVIYQENDTYGEQILKAYASFKGAALELLFGKEGITPKYIKTAVDENLEQELIDKQNRKEYQLPPKRIEPLYVGTPVVDIPEIDVDANVVRTEECIPESPPTIRITQTMVELEQEMHEQTKIAIDTYKNAKKAVIAYNEALFKFIETPVDSLDTNAFNQVASSNSARDSMLTTARAAQTKAVGAIDSLDRLLRAGVQAPPEVIAATTRYIRQFRVDLAKTEAECRAEEEKSVIYDRYKSKVEEAREFYKKELKLVNPEIDLKARQIKLGPDADLLLIYIYKQLLFMQNELAAIQTVRDEKLRRAISNRDDKLIIESRAEDLAMKDRVSKEKDFQMKSLKMEVESSKKLKEQLKKQFEVHQQVLQSAIAKKEGEIQATFNREAYERIEKERLKFKQELAEMTAKMRAIETALKKRAKFDNEARKSQAMWSASEALLATTRRPGDHSCIENEVEAVKKAGQGDKLVDSVVKGIPKEAVKDGIATDRALREKFDKMESAASSVALVTKEGASLPVYMLSWLQSKLLFSQFAEVPKDELEDRPVDFSNLDTFDILHRARYHMEHGNLADAVRYVNLLQGAPRHAAKGWLDDARRHLEVKQAAEAVMAHASAAAQQYLG